MKIRFTYLLTAVALLSATVATAQTAPRLVVQIVVSGMRADDLTRYAAGFGDNGFKLLAANGQVYTDCSCIHVPTSTVAGLATLTTGTTPSMHGIIGEEWFDITTRKRVQLTADASASGFGQGGADYQYSPHNLSVQTLGDALLYASPKSRVVSIAPDASSAVVAGGSKGLALWLDSRGNWTTSTAYGRELPAWVALYNRDDLNHAFVTATWYGKYLREKYLNKRTHKIILYATGEKQPHRPASQIGNVSDYLDCMPAGNTASFEFAKRAMSDMGLGSDNAPDLLTLCLDTPRHIVERYGPESVEYEDMLYCLDGELADFVNYLRAQFKQPDEQLLIVLTSDHGSSPAYNATTPERERFNTRQFEVVVNAFLSARYGQANWVSGYTSGGLYLNHQTVFDHHASLAAIESEVATFALQFRGVAHAISAVSLQENYFGNSYGLRMQNGFYPRRSGDVLISLMPEWIEERDNCVSLSGSMYGYDARIPLILYGAGLASKRCMEPATQQDIAPTLAAVLGISAPTASEGKILETVKTR